MHALPCNVSPPPTRQHNQTTTATPPSLLTMLKTQTIQAKTTRPSEANRMRLPDPSRKKQKCYLPTCCRLRLKSRVAPCRSSADVQSDVTLKEPPHGGYAGVRTGEAQNLGPAAHKKNCAEERCARRTRINEAGDGAPGSQDSITRGVQNLQLSDTPATQTTRTDPAMPNSRRPTQPR